MCILPSLIRLHELYESKSKHIEVRRERLGRVVSRGELEWSVWGEYDRNRLHAYMKFSKRK